MDTKIESMCFYCGYVKDRAVVSLRLLSGDGRRTFVSHAWKSSQRQWMNEQKQTCMQFTYLLCVVSWPSTCFFFFYSNPQATEAARTFAIWFYRKEEKCLRFLWAQICFQKGRLLNLQQRCSMTGRDGESGFDCSAREMCVYIWENKKKRPGRVTSSSFTAHWAT